MPSVPRIILNRRQRLSRWAMLIWGIWPYGAIRREEHAFYRGERDSYEAIARVCVAYAGSLALVTAVAVYITQRGEAIHGARDALWMGLILTGGASAWWQSNIRGNWAGEVLGVAGRYRKLSWKRLVLWAIPVTIGLILGATTNNIWLYWMGLIETMYGVYRTAPDKTVLERDQWALNKRGLTLPLEYVLRVKVAQSETART